MIFQDSSAKQEFKLASKKLGLFTYEQSYSKPRGCFIAVMDIYKLIVSYNSLKNNPLLNTHDVLPLIYSYLDQSYPDSALGIINTLKTNQLRKMGLFAPGAAASSSTSTRLLEDSKASDNDKLRLGPGM